MPTASVRRKTSVQVTTTRTYTKKKRGRDRQRTSTDSSGSVNVIGVTVVTSDPRKAEFVQHRSSSCSRTRWFAQLTTHPRHVLDPEQTSDDVLVRRHGQELHFHGPVLLETRLGPVLHARLQEDKRRQRQEGGVGSAAVGDSALRLAKKRRD